MTALLRRQAVIDKYAEIIGRNIYSQSLRDYCYKVYKDGKYYSDCCHHPSATLISRQGKASGSQILRACTTLPN